MSTPGRDRPLLPAPAAPVGGSDVSTPELGEMVNLHRFEAVAQELLATEVYQYVAGGAGDEHTLRANAERWADVQLAPRCLVDVGRIDTMVDLLGRTLAHPVLLAPTASHAMYHPGAELETLRGAAAAEALYVQSTSASTAVADVGAAARSPWWFQLYVQRDRGFTQELVRRAETAGAEALVLTVDTPVLGARDRDRRGRLPVATYPNLVGLPEPVPDDLPPHRRVYNARFDPTLSWPALEWLLSVSSRPVLVKGVLRPDVAAQAVRSGVAGVIVSNHGARNLDTVPATVDALPRVADAVAGQVPVLVDGGIRRGTDVAKALMLGAAAVLVGRPYVYALAAYGAEGVARVVDILRTELEMAMGLLGAPTLADLTPDLLWR